MKQEFDNWFDSDSSNLIFNNKQGVFSPKKHENQEWPCILRPEQKLILDQSLQIFPSVKRKYEERFNTKVQSSQSSSPYDDDQMSLDSRTDCALRSEHQTIIKQQKQQIKKVEEENRFLKQKIDDLSFRLKETQIQLNKLKYSGNNNITNFQSMKQACLKQIADLMAKNKGQAPQTCQAFRRLKDMTDFDGKIKVDLLNYFMSELLQNIINDSTFYLIDSILTNKGIWKDQTSTEKQKIRKVDEQIIDLMQLKNQVKSDMFKKDLRDALLLPANKYKQMWKTFYGSYINLLNQGFVLQNFLRNAYLKIQTYISKQNFAKLQLHFEKIKLRKDIRALRQSWFKQIQYDEQNSSHVDKPNTNKKTKTGL